MTRLVDRYVFGHVEPARPWLLLRGLLLLLAVDCWIDLVPHGGRYGVGDFNVAHFGWLDALQPTPTPGIYVGLLLFVGLLAFAMAVGTPSRGGLALLCASYTYGWSMSMLDSYQHHYLISLLLFSAIFLPTRRAEQALEVGASSSSGTSSSVGPAPAAGGALPSASVALGGVLLAIGVGDAALASGRGPTLFGMGSSVGWGIRSVLIVAGALLVYLPDSREPQRVSPEKEQTPQNAGTKKKRKKKGAKASSGRVAEKRAEKRAEARAEKAEPAKGTSDTSAWAYVSLCITCALVYFYTAITKMDPDWREGHALRRLGRSESFRALETEATTDGLFPFGVLSPDAFWSLMAKGAIAVQLVTAAAFLLAAAQDHRGARRWRRFVPLLGLAPLSFHIGAERLELEIGWFSYYMIFVVLVVFAPASALRPLLAGLSAPGRRLARRWSEPNATEVVVFALLGAIGLVAAGTLLDLPGSIGAGVLAALALALAVGLVMRRDRAQARRWSLAAAVAAGALYLGIANTEVRFDYYRFVGGDHRRRLEYDEALAAYEKANRYVVAPYCVQPGPRAEPVECYRSEEAAAAHLEREPGLELHTRDRRRQEAEMHRRVEGAR